MTPSDPGQLNPGHEHWFEPIADHLGEAYLRYSFTKGTAQEVAYLTEVLDLRPGDRVLDVGCGPGRHAHALAERGVVVHGIDISERFVEIASAHAPEGASFERLDARALVDTERLHGCFDAVICLCQGAFGLMTRRSVNEPDDDDRVVAGIARCVRPGGRVALSAFNAYFAVRYHTEAAFDADLGISHEHTEVRDPAGRAVQVDLWTGCYTPRELRMVLGRHELTVEQISSVEPGAYGADPPSVESPEFLVVAHRSR